MRALIIILVLFSFTPSQADDEVPYDDNDIKANRPAFIETENGIALYYEDSGDTGIIPWFGGVYFPKSQIDLKGVRKKDIANALLEIVNQNKFRKGGIDSLNPVEKRRLEVYLHAIALGGLILADKRQDSTMAERIRFVIYITRCEDEMVLAGHHAGYFRLAACAGKKELAHQKNKKLKERKGS